MADYLLQEEDYRGKIDWSVWRRIAAHIRPYWKQVGALCLSGAVVATIEAVQPTITGWMIDEARAHGLTSRLWWLSGLYGALVILFACLIGFFILMAGQAATGIGYDLRNSGFKRLQELSFSYFDTRPVGWLVSRLASDCSKISNLIPWLSLDLFWGSWMLIGITTAMLWQSVHLAMWVLMIVPPLAVISVIFQRRLLDSSRRMRKMNSILTANYDEAMMGVRTTKSLVRESENLEEFQVFSGDMYRYSVQNALQNAVYLPMVIAIGSVGVGIALWQGGAETIEEATGVSLGVLVAFMQYSTLFYQPIQELARRFADLQSAQAAAERVQGLLDTEPEIKDSPTVARAIEECARRRELSSDDSGDGAIAFDGGGERISTIEFRDVSFWYKEGEPVLEHFDLTIHAGETIALVGATGGGKSTMVSLVGRFYEPNRGSILINDVDYRERSLHWLQSNLGVVLQSPHLFSGTVRENIRYGRLEATDEEIEAAARMVNAHEFITEHEGGYDADVGEGGTKLSTGERQLISLARAVLARPQIFIMDEATSSVDTEAERLIQDAVEAVLRDRIAFVIAHRLSTIRSADSIVVIEGGRIVEKGSHDRLIARRGKYFDLYTKQFARERERMALSVGVEESK